MSKLLQSAGLKMLAKPLSFAYYNDVGQFEISLPDPFDYPDLTRSHAITSDVATAGVNVDTDRGWRAGEASKFSGNIDVARAALLQVRNTTALDIDYPSISNFDYISGGNTGGDWALYFDWTKLGEDVTISISQDYLDFLKETGVEWVGFYTAVFVDSYTDSSVELVFRDNDILFQEDRQFFSLSPANMKYMIDIFEKNGFKTYLDVAFEASPEPNSPLRYLFNSDINRPEVQALVPEGDWVWDPSHPNHAPFVKEFWETYTDQVKYYASLAEECGMDMFSIGTEIDNLIRTRSHPNFPTGFAAEVTNLINETRSVFSGLVTYDQYFGAVENEEYFGGHAIWTDTDMDVIGISAYFKLVNEVHGVTSVEVLEEGWRRVFQETLVPLQEQNPDKPIVFTEFGYTNSIYSVMTQAAQEFEKYVFTDGNGNGLDDGQEVQANAYQAFFNVNREYDSLVRGMLLWNLGERMWTDEYYADYNYWIGFAVRDKLAENVLADEYYIQDAGIEGEIDIVTGGSGADKYVSSAGDHLFKGMLGDDIYTINKLTDLVKETSDQGIDVVNIEISTAGGTYLLPDNVENSALLNSVAYNLKGNALGNSLLGNDAANVLVGLEGNDVIDGKSGADVIEGGIGADVLTGGGGADVFSYAVLDESRKGKNADRITDFVSGEDIVDLNAIDANSLRSGNQDFKFIGEKGFSGKAGQIRFDNGHLSGDVDGNGKADFDIVLNDLSSIHKFDLAL